MKFIRLEIKNLASLDRPEGEVIEFEKVPVGRKHHFQHCQVDRERQIHHTRRHLPGSFQPHATLSESKNDRNQSIEIYGAKDKDENARLAPTDSRNILTRGKREGYSKHISG